jgi:uncharacterized protein YbaR (Trm112 family)
MTDNQTTVSWLRCPATGQRLVVLESARLAAINGRILAGLARTRTLGVPERPLGGGLITEDGVWIYPIVDGIPVLLAGEAIAAA